MTQVDTRFDSIDLRSVLALPRSPDWVAGVDVGGTRFRARLAGIDGATVKDVEFENRELQSVTDGLVRFLLKCGLRPARLSLGITGAQTADGTIHQPNVPAWWPDFNWIHASEALDTQIVPLNDMGAAALAMRRLKDQPEFNQPILEGQTVPGGKILTVGLGTGLGDAFIDGNYVGQGEAGHQPLSPRDEIEDQILSFARSELNADIVSFEDVLSGSKGLPRLYRFFEANRELARHEAARLLPTVRLTRNMDTAMRTKLSVDAAGHQSPAELISATGLEPSMRGFDSMSFLALVKHADMFGAYLGGRGVAVVASGGIKLVGGVISQALIRFWLRYSKFEQRVRGMGVHQPMAERFQVDWVTHPAPGLVGAIEAALIG